MIFSIMNPNHEDGGLVGFVCMGIPCVFAGLISFLIWWSGVIKERLRVQHSKDRLVYQASFFGLGFLSEKRRLSEAVYLGTDKDGDHAIIHGRSSEGVEWELDMSGTVTELAESEDPYNPPYKKWAREIAKAIGIELRSK